jgi:signal transduction histidine kinase
MLTVSNLEPIQPASPGDTNDAELQARSVALLAGAFSDFISASSRLENSYRELQQEVQELRQELSAREAALTSSLAENDRMRLDLDQIVDSMPCGVLVLGRRGEILMINRESGRLLGLDGVQFPDGVRAKLQQIPAFQLENESPQEFCLTTPTGKRWIEVRQRPLVYPATQPDRAILILRDITAQKRAAEERETARKTLALAEIATILAHEIKNPLASMELFAELLENDTERRDQWISNLRAGIRTLANTVNNVLTFHNAHALQLTAVDLSSVIRSALNFVHPLAQQASVSLLWTPHRGEAQVMGNESALHQVVLNLVANAIRHTPQGGAVTVSLRSDDEQVIAEFSDTGCGIRPDQMEHIFEPGFSGNGSTSGLGLAVCRRILTQHGGQIAVANRAPYGARFHFSLPLLAPEGAQP